MFKRDGTPVILSPGRFGLSVIAARNIRWGEQITRFDDCEILDQPTSKTLMLSQFEFAYEPKIVAVLDHSCDPNTLVDVARRSLIANQDIPEGAPLTRFYPSTEWVLTEPFRCVCGVPTCIGEVRGAQFLSAAVLFSHYVGPQIREMHHALAVPGPQTSRRPSVLGDRRKRLRLVGIAYSGKERRNALLD